jgi:hypothetical protein
MACIIHDFSASDRKSNWNQVNTKHELPLVIQLQNRKDRAIPTLIEPKHAASQVAFCLSVCFGLFQTASDTPHYLCTHPLAYNSREGMETKIPGKGFDWSGSGHVSVSVAGG